MARILVIDDDEYVRNFVVRALVRFGHEVTTASEGETGLRLQREQPFDLLITDILMPGMEGIELIAALQDDEPSTPVLAISGAGSAAGPADPLVDARLLGAAAALSKPFSVDQLVEEVSGLLEQVGS